MIVQRQGYSKGASLMVEKNPSNDVSNLFVACYKANDIAHSVWLVDNSCSNHMSDVKELFRDLDESQKLKVRLGDDKEIQVARKGTVALNTQDGNVKLLPNMQFVPNLAHNL